MITIRECKAIITALYEAGFRSYKVDEDASLNDLINKFKGIAATNSLQGSTDYIYLYSNKDLGKVNIHLNLHKMRLFISSKDESATNNIIQEHTLTTIESIVDILSLVLGIDLDIPEQIKASDNETLQIIQLYRATLRIDYDDLYEEVYDMIGNAILDLDKHEIINYYTHNKNDIESNNVISIELIA